MGELQYRILDDSLRHASFASVKSSLSDRYRARKKEQAEQRARNGSPTKSIVGRSLKRNPYGNYKSVYYDPVARHERYLREKDHVTRPYGTGESAKSGGKGRSGKGSGGKGKSAKGRGGASKQNLTDAIAKLREASNEDIEKHKSEYLKEIEDLKRQLQERLEQLGEAQKDEESELNVAEIRGHIQALREQIENKGLDLQKWINDEREALNRRIAALRN